MSRLSWKLPRIAAWKSIPLQSRAHFSIVHRNCRLRPWLSPNPYFLRISQIENTYFASLSSVLLCSYLASDSHFCLEARAAVMPNQAFVFVSCQPSQSLPEIEHGRFNIANDWKSLTFVILFLIFPTGLFLLKFIAATHFGHRFSCDRHICLSLFCHRNLWFNLFFGNFA